MGGKAGVLILLGVLLLLVAYTGRPGSMLAAFFAPKAVKVA